MTDKCSTFFSNGKSSITYGLNLKKNYLVYNLDTIFTKAENDSLKLKPEASSVL